MIAGMNDLPLCEIEITVLDYETTGSLHGYPNEPWQIGMVSLRGGKVVAESQFESLLRVNADRPFNPHAPGRHVVLRTAIAAAPTPENLWLQLAPRLTQYPLCAHNVATEKKFLRAMAPLHAFGPWIDTLRVVRRVWPGGASYALGDLIEQFALTPRVENICPDRMAHDALYDAVASAMLLEYLLEQPRWNHVTLGDLSKC